MHDSTIPSIQEEKLKRPLMHERVHKVTYPQRMLFSGEKESGADVCCNMMTLDKVMPIKRSQKQKAAQTTIPFIRNMQNSQIH